VCARGGEVGGLEDDQASDGGAALEQRAGEADAARARERAEVLQMAGPVLPAELRRSGAVAADEGEERHRGTLSEPGDGDTARSVATGFTRGGGSVKLSG
jgi:hypothetical protein